MAEPAVSVVIPAYNAEHWIGEAIGSVRVQGAIDYEIIVVDDASTDNTVAAVEGCMATEERLRLVRLARNAGPAAARNRGLDAARGEWIATLDADDRFKPGRLTTLLAIARGHGADMVSDNLLLCPVRDAGATAPMIPREMLPAPMRLDAAEFIRRNVGSRKHPRVSYGFMHPMIRRDFLERHCIRYDERNRFAEDYMLYVTCLLHGAVWWVTPEPMYLYRVRGGSLTEVQTAADLDRIRRFERSLLGSPEVRADRRLARALRRHKAVIDRCYYYRAFTDAVKQGEAVAALRLLFESPASFLHITNESLAQAPVICRKAVRGGYRRKVASA